MKKDRRTEENKKINPRKRNGMHRSGCGTKSILTRQCHEVLCFYKKFSNKTKVSIIETFRKIQVCQQKYFTTQITR